MYWPAGKAERRYAGITHVDVSEFGENEARRILELADRRRVSISGLGYYSNPLSADLKESERVTDHLRKVIHAAALLGVNQVNSFVGRNPAISIDDNWPRFL